MIKLLSVFEEEPCVICGKSPSDYVMFDEGEPLFGWCEQHHEESKTREDCICLKRQ